MVKLFFIFLETSNFFQGPTDLEGHRGKDGRLSLYILFLIQN